MHDELADRILERTRRQLSALQLRIGQQSVQISGVAPSFHVKQLALEALLDPTAPCGNLTIIDRIQVRQTNVQS
jgi:hypothetical protein